MYCSKGSTQRHLTLFLRSATYYDSQTCSALQVKQMPPVLGQFPLTTLEEKVNKFTARIPNMRAEAYTE